MKRHLPLYISLAMVAILLASCTVTEKLDLQDNGGRMDSSIEVEPIFVDVLQDLSQFLPEGNESIMDTAIASFADQLADSKQARNILFVKTGEYSYAGTFGFEDISKLIDAMNQQKEQTVLLSNDHSLTFHVDLQNYTQLEEIVPFLADPNVEVYLAKYNEGYSEQDYLDMLVFALGDEAPEAVKRSVITLEVNVPGDIVTLEGAEKTGSRSFRYSFPLIDFLLLNRPLAFHVEWK